MKFFKTITLFLLTVFVISLWSCKKKKTDEPEKEPVDLSLPLDKGNGIYAYDFDGIYFEVDANAAGRVTSLKLNGTEFLLQKSVNASNYGNSLWPSPQSIWNWPPPVQLDVNAYTGGIEGKVISLTSAKHPSTGFIFKKEYSVDLSNKSILLKYTITNQSGTTKSVAGWEITRVLPGGITFYPSGLNTKTGLLAPLTKDSIGCTWFDYNAVTIPSGVPKLISDGTQGWLAHIAGNTLLLKRFEDIAVSSIAPSEGEIELYTAPNLTYMEVEQQGPYTSLADGESLTWEVKWFLKDIPANITKEAGNQGLLDYVNSIQ